MIEASKDRDDVGARVGVLFGEDAGEKDTQCLFARAMSANDGGSSRTCLKRKQSGQPYIKRIQISHTSRASQGLDRS